MTVAHDWIEPRVCVDENMVISPDGLLQLAPWSVPRLVRDVMCTSTADGKIKKPQPVLPGVKMMDQTVSWKNNTPVPAQMRIDVTRSTKSWVVSNPNAVQIRDRWTRVVNNAPDEPVINSISNGRCGSSIDVGTNSVAEPNPGRQWLWQGAGTVPDWFPTLLEPGDTLSLWYQCYYWTPPPWSDNSNKNNPQHNENAGFTRIQFWAFPVQGRLIAG